MQMFETLKNKNKSFQLFYTKKEITIKSNLTIYRIHLQHFLLFESLSFLGSTYKVVFILSETLTPEFLKHHHLYIYAIKTYLVGNIYFIFIHFFQNSFWQIKKYILDVVVCFRGSLTKEHIIILCELLTFLIADLSVFV